MICHYLVLVFIIVYSRIVNILAASLCPEQGWYNSETNTCYWMVNIDVGAANSDYFCGLSGGQLAVFPDQTSLDWVKNTLAPSITPLTDIFWIGMTDSTAEGTFQTFSGQPVSWTSWGTSQPSDDGSMNFDCVFVDTSDWKMFDTPCSMKMPGLCNLTLGHCPAGSYYLPDHLLCYWKTPPPPRGPDQNEALCLGDGGTMAVIPNAAVDNEFTKPPLSSLLTGINELYIGVTDRNIEGVEQSFLGDPITWTNWKSGQPNDPNRILPTLPSEDCVTIILSENRVWQDVSCTKVYQALCYRDLQTHAAVSVTYPTTHSTTTPSTVISTDATSERSTTSSIKLTTETIVEGSTTASTNLTVETTIEGSTTASTKLTTEGSITTSAKLTTEASTEGGMTGGINESCECPCNQQINMEEIQKQIEKIMKDLTIDFKTTSAYKRTKTSIYEDRPVARGLGCVGITILCVIFGSIILLDAGTLFRHLKLCWHRFWQVKVK